MSGSMHACIGTCKKERKANLTRSCCALRICKRWSGTPLGIEPTLRVVEAHCDRDYAQGIRAEAERCKAEGWPD